MAKKSREKNHVSPSIDTKKQQTTSQFTVNWRHLFTRKPAFTRQIIEKYDFFPPIRGNLLLARALL